MELWQLWILGFCFAQSLVNGYLVYKYLKRLLKVEDTVSVYLGWIDE